MASFDELGLSEPLLKGIKKLGFESPTPVQEKVIPHLLSSEQSLVALAQTGTGKTAAFGLPLLELLDENQQRKPQALILCPTRELCLQIASDLKNFAKFLSRVNILAVYGGAPIVNQLRELERGVNIIVATPGRMNDILRRRKANLSEIKRVVLDEADEMLNMGFKEELDAILEQVPETATTLLFSATMPAAVSAIAKNYMQNPKEITIGQRNAGAENVSHEFCMVHAKDRYLSLKRLADFYPDMYALVFCRTRIETQEVANKLMQDGYNAEALHGDLSQAQRDRVMEKFRSRKLHMLVATDVAARGVDVNDLTHVINYQLPDDVEIYTHRSGRTGRAGRKGIAISIIHMREQYRIRQLEKKVNKKFTQRMIPTGREVCEAQLFSMIKRVKEVEVDHQQIDAYMPAIFETLDDMSREDLVKHFVSIEFNRFLDYYRNAPDLNANAEDNNKEKFDKNMSCIFISVGKMDGLVPKELVSMLDDIAGEKVNIGLISITKSFTLVDIDPKQVTHVLAKLNDDLYVGDRKVQARLDRKPKQSNRGDRRGRSDRRSYGDRSERSDRRSQGGGDRRRGNSGSYGGRKRPGDFSRKRSPRRTGR
jgi:ATP-dependent RNA helicase DeaD